MKEFIKDYRRYLLTVAGIILTLGISTSVAYIYKVSNKTNTFETGSASSRVVETFNDLIKSNVYIRNDGNIKEYVRVFIDIYYKDDDGTILFETPVENIDYSITMSSSSNWLYNSNDNFYYYKMPLGENTNTDILISECKELKTHQGKVLNVDIHSQVIQAEPEDAVISSWGVNISNGDIVLGGN